MFFIYCCIALAVQTVTYVYLSAFRRNEYKRILLLSILIGVLPIIAPFMLRGDRNEG